MHDATLLVSSSCHHCAAVMRNLGELLKLGRLGVLNMINIEQRPEMARQLGVRTVPWTKIGPFELQGMYTYAELERWANASDDPGGWSEYVLMLLGSGQLQAAGQFVQQHPSMLEKVPEIISHPETDIQVRVGVSALLEERAGKKEIIELIPGLSRLVKHKERRVRADAAYFLGLTHHASAEPVLKILEGDESPEVREIAKEAMEGLSQLTGD
ncbi:MAG: hypothetical protein BMS9Abin36_0464 [Gammaproteobacteria bacterium]|nr:MAG: hypothetical protein BMS9Abin36_0464 [Gammaproteobacteria bacterium]